MNHKISNEHRIVKRIASIDFVRGLVMVIMALDHTRDLLHASSLTQNPTDLNTTTPILFFTRWITHLCAPTFVFLAGTSAYLSLKQNGIVATRSFLLTRGLWLILLEFTIVNFGLWFDLQFRSIIFEVIATIGFGLVILSFLLQFSTRSLGIVGLIIIFVNGVFPAIPFAEGSVIKAMLSPLFILSFYSLSGEYSFLIAYPPIPWLGIMLVGFALGSWFDKTPDESCRRFIKAGIAALACFFVIRILNMYGDIPWSNQKNPFFTFLSFINVSKYPPSLLFSLSMLGIMLLVLGFTSTMRKNKLADFFATYGKAPLFYFIAHFYLVHLTMVAILLVQGYGFSDMVFGRFNPGRPKGESGISLWAVYVVWIAVVAVMYPLCKWYGAYKAQHPEKKWLRFL